MATKQRAGKFARVASSGIAVECHALPEWQGLPTYLELRQASTILGRNPA